MGPVNAVLWVGGLGWYLLGRGGRPHRFVGIGAALYLVLLLATRGKSYYFGTALPPLLAAGAVALEARVASPLARAVAPAAVALQLALVPIAVPILSEAATVRWMATLGVRPPPLERDRPGALPQVMADMHGWQALADEVTRVYLSLPEAEQRTAIVFGQNYGQAAAIDVLAAGRGLPPAVSGHNQYFLWGVPEGRGDPAIVIGEDEEDCGGIYREKIAAARMPHDPWIRPFEDEHTIWICRGATAPFSSIWPRLRFFL
jgi:hypothetical protein